MRERMSCTDRLFLEVTIQGGATDILRGVPARGFGPR
jgi:hypothetical protein